MYSFRKKIAALREDPKSRGFAGMLGHTAAAAIWTRVRLHDAGYVDDPRCQRCFMAPEDDSIATGSVCATVGSTTQQ